MILEHYASNGRSCAAVLGFAASVVFVSGCEKKPGKVDESAAAVAAPVETTRPEPAPASPSAVAAKAPSATAVASAASKATPSDLCDRLCGASASLKCSGASACQGRCAEMLGVPVCNDVMRAALECFAAVPVAGWECGEDGAPAVKDGECEPAQARVAACMGKT